MGEGALRCSFNLSPKVFEDFPVYSSLHSGTLHLHLCMTLLFLVMLSLSLGGIRRLLMVLPLPKRCLFTYLIANVLNIFTETLGIRNHYMVVVVAIVGTVDNSVIACVLFLALSLLRTHVGFAPG